MTTPDRQPAGTPTGGQFAATERAEADVTLAYTRRTPTHQQTWANPRLTVPATREEINAILAPGSRWTLGNHDGDSVIGSPQPVTILGHQESTISVQYANSRGGPYVLNKTFGVDPQGRVYVFDTKIWNPDGPPVAEIVFERAE